MEVAAPRAATAAQQKNTWMIVFAFSFLALMIDGADLMFLSYSLASLTATSA